DADGAVWWLLDGCCWNDTLLAALDHCLDRITYFGRAESFTRIDRSAADAPEPNCTLNEEIDSVGTGAVPVLVPRLDASRDQIEGLTINLSPTTPPGAQVMYALRPLRPSVQERPNRLLRHKGTNLLQFAIGWNVAPRRRVIARLTSRFRGTVIRELLRIKTGNPSSTWSSSGKAVRESIKYMTGKDASGKPLNEPHRHAEFLAWCEDDRPTRLVVWRDGISFDQDEQDAILRATRKESAWAGHGPDSWRVKLIPLDRTVPPPPGFDGKPASAWETMTPYVPPRHHLRKGNERPRESLEEQIKRELVAREFPRAENVSVSIGAATWVTVHIPRSQRPAHSSIGDRRGYHITLRFDKPIHGPLRLGHSSSFGLGLFVPVE
ncbi:MAG TPA: type I-U CRISPR-associated protein Csb2, partial [Rhodanobacteraceae bacterium]|nr:type I-U CRISPR-associated protein Csb2 [Rhodanobacteraceae bacterium]